MTNYLGKAYRHLSPRRKMPQFDDRVTVRKLDVAVKQKGGRVRTRRVNPFQLTPMQRYVGVERIRNINPKTLSGEILISNDGAIIDGHHRWGAAHYRMRRGDLPNHFRLKAREYDMEGSKLLKLARQVSRKRI